MITKKEIVEVQGFTSYAFNSYSLEAPIKISHIHLFEYKWIETYVTKIKVIILLLSNRACIKYMSCIFIQGTKVKALEVVQKSSIKLDL